MRYKGQGLHSQSGSVQIPCCERNYLSFGQKWQDLGTKYSSDSLPHPVKTPVNDNNNDTQTAVRMNRMEKILLFPIILCVPSSQSLLLSHSFSPCPPSHCVTFDVSYFFFRTATQKKTDLLLCPPQHPLPNRSSMSPHPSFLSVAQILAKRFSFFRNKRKTHTHDTKDSLCSIS